MLREKTQWDGVFVPQGAEYGAVCRGLVACTGPQPPVWAMPIGPEPVRRFLQRWRSTEGQGLRSVLLLGVCGSLVPQYGVGAAVLYEHCLDGTRPGAVRHGDRTLTAGLHARLGSQVSLVSGVSCDRILCTVAEKQQIAQQFPAAVVDMEGFTAFDCLQSWQIQTAMVRVVSDEASQPLPDLAAALSPEGQMQPIPLAWQLLRQPQRSVALIRGSLRALQQLQHLTTQIFA